MKVSALIVALILGVTVTANCETIASLSGPDHGGELISASRVVSFRFIMSATYVDVTVSARLAAPFGPFDGTAYLTFGGCCSADQSVGELAHSAFTVSSPNASGIVLFQGLTLPPSNYYLTLSGNGPVAGLWVIAKPVTFFSRPDSGVGGGDSVAQGANVNALYPPSSKFSDGEQETQFIVTTTAVPEPSPPFLIMAGLIALISLRAGSAYPSTRCRRSA